MALEWLDALRAYTIALKNLEEINADKKAYHLHIILEAWGRLIGYAILLVRISSEIEVDLGGGVSLNLTKMFGELKAVLLRSVLIALPCFISGLIRNYLGTEKLRLMLAAINPAGNELVAIRFVNEGLYLDLRLPDFIRRLDQLRQSLADHQFFAESLFIKLVDGYVRFPLRDETVDTQYRRIMAELRADIGGMRGTDRDKFVSKQLQSYKKTN